MTRETPSFETQVRELRGRLRAAERDVVADMGEAALDEGAADLAAAVIPDAYFPKAVKAEVIRREGYSEYSWAQPFMAKGK